MQATKIEDVADYRQQKLACESITETQFAKFFSNADELIQQFQRKLSHCWYCADLLTEQFISMPLKKEVEMDDVQYIGKGSFCSFSCAYGSLKTEPGIYEFNSLLYLRDLRLRLHSQNELEDNRYSFEDRIQTWPWMLHKNFGGVLDTDAFKQSIDSISVIELVHF